MAREDYGKLITPDAKLQRKYFSEMVKLLGVNVKYQYPTMNKQYNLQGELNTDYSDPEFVGCIFEEHPTQQTTKMLGWVAEATTNTSVIHLPYDLHDLQVGCLVEVPSAFDNTEGRLFRITKLSATMIYPSSIACEIVPEYKSVFEKSDQNIFINTNFNLLNEQD